MGILIQILLLFKTKIPVLLISFMLMTFFASRPFWLLCLLIICKGLLFEIIYNYRIFLFDHQTLSLDNLILLALLVVTFFSKSIKSEKLIINTPLTVPIFLLWGSYLAEMFSEKTISDFLFQGQILFKSFFLLVVLFIVIVNLLAVKREKRIRMIIIITLVIVSLHTLFAISQYLSKFGILSAKVVFFHMPYRIGDQVFYVRSAARGIGLLDRGNSFGKYLVMAIIILLSVKFVHRKKIISILSLLLFTSALLYSLSREAIFGFIFSMLLSNIILKRSKRELCAIFLGIFFMGFIGLTIPHFRTRFVNIFKLDQQGIAISDHNFDARIMVWKTTVGETIKANPYIGLGQQYLASHTSDSTYTRMFVAGGLVALACFLSFLFVTLYRSYKLYFNSKGNSARDFSLCVFRMTLAMIIFGVASNAFADGPVLFTYITLVASLAALTARAKVIPRKNINQ